MEKTFQSTADRNPSNLLMYLSSLIDKNEDLFTGSKSCKDMQCQRRCEYTGTAGCNQFVLGPCCKNKRDPYRLTCPAEPLCLKEELYAPYVYSSSSESAEGDSLSRSEVCAKPFVTGPCNDMSIRWFFHAKGGVCKPFIYGGCLGNENNFQSEVRCQQFCLA
ncbi:unnamed protein product [Notodromas monacha]|uniref:BPTI/Kunitz inhibitor domain-containing protein n=1 Tax=Notodromas monacha TaxID=399045 RepID=A0A7R9GEK3_9CRUS|nr:unnamed protein product [Notodromas monacha]CAG0917963.1 unnamed protein product [Notodromas monacha]